MRLSEAIRLGSMEGQQGFFSGACTTDADARCAIGAAAWAVGALQDRPNETFYALIQVFPILGIDTEYPIELHARHSNQSLDEFHKPIAWLLDHIWRLNDIGQVPREAIADWVATIESRRLNRLFPK